MSFAASRSLHAVPILFVGTVLIAGLSGELVARFYSEPMNRLLRRRWGEGPHEPGSVSDTGAMTQ